MVWFDGGCCGGDNDSEMNSIFWCVVGGIDRKRVYQTGIKKIFDDEKVNYMKKMIVQASHTKGILEKLFIDKSSHTVFSLDIESFYIPFCDLFTS
jgi:hypothetical protein